MKLLRITFAPGEIIKFFVFYIFISAISLFPLKIVSAQTKDRVEIVPRIVADNVAKDCKNLQIGKVIFYLIPDYPVDAKNERIGGTIEVTVKIDEKGKVSEIEKVTGNRLLQGAASEAANKVKFSQTSCAGIPVAISGVIDYNFILAVAIQNYFSPQRTEDFSDVKRDSQNYEAIRSLTENYKIAFGFENKRFYPDAPLTRGELAHFLRLTLDLLSERAKKANKTPRQIGLFYSNNPNKLASVDKIKDLDKKAPFYDSVRALISNYNISLASEKNEFGGGLPVTQNQLIDSWTKIFGSEAVPVNFERIKDSDRIITRGEFALFLHESLGVLTYKVLP